MFPRMVRPWDRAAEIIKQKYEPDEALRRITRLTEIIRSIYPVGDSHLKKAMNRIITRDHLPMMVPVVEPDRVRWQVASSFRQLWSYYYITNKNLGRYYSEPFASVVWCAWERCFRPAMMEWTNLMRKLSRTALWNDFLRDCQGDTREIPLLKKYLARLEELNRTFRKQEWYREVCQYQLAGITAHDLEQAATHIKGDHWIYLRLLKEATDSYSKNYAFYVLCRLILALPCPLDRR